RLSGEVDRGRLPSVRQMNAIGCAAVIRIPRVLILVELFQETTLLQRREVLPGPSGRKVLRKVGIGALYPVIDAKWQIPQPLRPIDDLAAAGGSDGGLDSGLHRSLNLSHLNAII